MFLGDNMKKVLLIIIVVICLIIGLKIYVNYNVNSYQIPVLMYHQVMYDEDYIEDFEDYKDLKLKENE